MDSDPHVRQPLQPEDEPSQVSESLGRLQLDKSADDDTHPSTPTRSTLQSTQSRVSISDDTLQEVYQCLQRNIQPDDSDKVVLRALGTVWFNVNKALKEDPILKPRLADEDGFQENVQKYGEKQFVKFLKDMAKKKNWRDLLEDCTSSLSSRLKPSDRVLSLAVFLKQISSDESNSPESKYSEVSKIGAQSSEGQPTFR
jgi:hypothetical protein